MASDADHVKVGKTDETAALAIHEADGQDVAVSEMATGSQGSEADFNANMPPSGGKLAINGQLQRCIEHLASVAARLTPSIGGDASTALNDAIAALSSEVDHAAAEASGLAVLLNDTLQQVQLLTTEKRELHRKEEDAVLDTQLKAAQEETERLRIAGDAYKRELLEQKLSDTEWILATELERLKECEADKEALAITIKELRGQLRASGLSEGQLALASLPATVNSQGGDLILSSLEREELATLLTAGEGDRRSVDAQALVKAAKGLRDTAVLEQHLQQSLQEKQRLADSVDELQDIVYSKTFKAPSAWADRERKYKMEKLAWEEQIARQHDRVEKLKSENKRYRDTNRTVEFEAQAEKLQAQVRSANAARVVAQQEAHELRLKQRPADGEFTNDGAVKEYTSPFSSKLSKDHQNTAATVQPGHMISAHSSASDFGAAAASQLLHTSEVSAAIHNLNEAGNGTERPKAPSVFLPGRTRISRGAPPTASPHSSVGNSSPHPSLPTDSSQEAKAGFRSPFPDVRRLFSNYPQVASPTSADNPQQSQTSHLFKGPAGADVADNSSAHANTHPTSTPEQPASDTADQQRQSGPLIPDSTKGSIQHPQASPPVSSSDIIEPRLQLHVQGQHQFASTATVPDSPSHTVEPTGKAATLRDTSECKSPNNSHKDAPAATASQVAGPLFSPHVIGADSESGSLPDHVSASHLADDESGHTPQDNADVSSSSMELHMSPALDSQRNTTASAVPSSESRDESSKTELRDDSAREMSSDESHDTRPEPHDTSPRQKQNNVSPRGYRADEPSGPYQRSSSLPAGNGSPGHDNRDTPRDTPGSPGSVISSPVSPLRPSKRDSSSHGSANGRPSLRRERSSHTFYGQQLEGDDVGALKYQAAELTSRVELMQTQLSKAALAAERGEEDRARLEAELTSALDVAGGKADKSALDAMQSRLQDLMERKGARDEETAKKLHEWEERLRGADAALAAAHREHQASEKRLAKLVSQLAAAKSALGAQAASVVASDSASSSSGDEAQDQGNATDRPRGAEAAPSFSWGNVSGLTDEDLAAGQLREENEVLMHNLVRSKLEMAELQNDYLKTKRALIRAVEKQAQMSESMDLLKSEVELSQKGGGAVGLSASLVAALSNSLHRSRYYSNH